MRTAVRFQSSRRLDLEHGVRRHPVALPKPGGTADGEDVATGGDEAFCADPTVEYWVRSGTGYVPATADQVAEIREYEALSRLESFQRVRRSTSTARRLWALLCARVTAPRRARCDTGY